MFRQAVGKCGEKEGWSIHGELTSIVKATGRGHERATECNSAIRIAGSEGLSRQERDRSLQSRRAGFNSFGRSRDTLARSTDLIGTCTAGSLRGSFKISDEHPRHFIWDSLPPPPPEDAYMYMHILL